MSDLSNVKPLAIGRSGWPAKEIPCWTATAQEWTAALSGYSGRARGHAANLAAHNWDVYLIDGRLFIDSIHSDTSGHWVSFEGDFTSATAEEHAALYEPGNFPQKRQITAPEGKAAP